MDAVIPWPRLIRLIEPYYPKAGNGRQPPGLEKMLQHHLRFPNYRTAILPAPPKSRPKALKLKILGAAFLVRPERERTIRLSTQGRVINQPQSECDLRASMV